MVRKTSTKSTFPQFFIVGFILISVFAAGALLFGGQLEAFTHTPTQIDVAQAADLRDIGAFILDVREAEEWDEVRIPDSTHIPLGQLAARIDEVPTDREIVVVCRSGNRSQTGRDQLLRAGFENVTSMAGGIIHWKNVGYPTISGP